MMEEKLIKSLREGVSSHEIYEKATKNDIKQTELQLNCKLPKSYCKFVSEFSNGAYLYEIQEVSAVGYGNQQIIPIQKIFLQGLTDIKAKTKDAIISINDGGSVEIQYLIPFSLDHNGNAWCFIANEMIKEEYKVAYFDCHNTKLYGLLDNFNEWLMILMNSKQEVIRTLYDEKFINLELGLG